MKKRHYTLTKQQNRIFARQKGGRFPDGENLLPGSILKTYIKAQNILQRIISLCGKETR